MQKKIEVEAMLITDHQSLDPITVFWQDYGPGSGQVTIYCYGEAWTSYWGGMPELSVKEFFLKADVGYLTNKLHGSQFQKRTKGHEQYLGRIINAIKQELAVEKAEAA